MKIKHNEIEIDIDKPFANCKLGRAKYADTLTKIVGNYKDGFVLAVNSEWGTGKTTFVKMWEQLLKSKGFNTVYFNAWENDFDSNPLTAMMSELKSIIKPKTEEIFKSVVEKGAVLSKNILPQLLKAIASKYIDTEIVKDLIENTTKGTTEIFEEEISEYAQKKKSLKDFKINLAKFIKESFTDKPIIFIIDELDRCRPSYSVEVLEQIKHFFNVPGIVFVLSIDKTQLGHAIRGVYGNDRINADEYLRRFIDIEYSIPSPDMKEFCNYLYDYFEFDAFFLSEGRRNHSEFSSDKSSFITIAHTLFEKINLNLRQQEKVFAHARIALILFNENQFLIPELYLLLVFIKNFHKDFYIKMSSNSISLDDLVSEYEALIPSVLNDESRRSFIEIEALLIFTYNNSLPHDLKKDLIQRTKDTDEYTVVVKSKLDVSLNNITFIETMKHVYRNFQMRRIGLHFLCSRIDLTDYITT